MDVLRAALEYAGAGIAAHWLQPKSKLPIGQGWSTRPTASLQELQDTYRKGNNLGVRPGKFSKVGDRYLVVIDLDIRIDSHRDIALAKLSELFPFHSDLPTIQSGSGGHSRHFWILLPVPVNSQMLAHSDVEYTGDDGHVHFAWEIEAYGTGKQTAVPPSIHPASGKEYIWLANRPEFDLGIWPEACLVDTLPCLAVDGWDDMFEDSGNDFDFVYHLKQPLPISDEQVAQCLDTYRADGLHYNDWLRVGQALHHQYRGDDTGFQLWLNWSEQSSKHDDSQMAYRWDSFGRYQGGHGPVTMYSILKLAGMDPKAIQRIELLHRFMVKINEVSDMGAMTSLQGEISKIPFTELNEGERSILAGVMRTQMAAVLGKGVQPPTRAEIKKQIMPTKAGLADQAADMEVPGWMKPWVYVTADEVFFHRGTGERISERAFNALYDAEAGKLFSYNDTGLLTAVHAAEAALNIFQIKKPYQTMYWPGRKSVFTDDGKLYANSYRDTGPKADQDTGSRRGVELMMIHLRNLFPSQKHRELVLDFLAHIVQHPGKKLLYAILIKGVQGDGKTWMLEMLQSVLGRTNTTLIKSAHLRKEFNGYCEHSILCGIEEIKQHNADALDVLNNMKDMITNRTLPVERKGVDISKIRNFANFFLTTNYSDALPITNDDNRYAVLFTRFATSDDVDDWASDWAKSSGYEFFPALYDEVQSNPYQFREFFEQYKFSDQYAPNRRAPHTGFARIMEVASRSEAEMLLLDIVDKGQNPALSRKCFDWGRFKTKLDALDPENRIHGRSVSTLMGKLGFFVADPDRVCHNGGKYRIWTSDRSLFDDQMALTAAGLQTIKTLLSQQEAQDRGGFEDNVESLR